MQRYEWYAVAATVGAAWFGYQLFGPNPPIVVSRETTYLTEPLAEDGLPDYAKWFLDQQRAGVTTENNAAIPLLQAMWPANLESSQYKLVCDEVGMQVPQRDGLWDPSDDWDRDDSICRATAVMLLDRSGICPSHPVRLAADYDAWQEAWEGELEGEPLDDEVSPFDVARERAEQMIRAARTTPWRGHDLPALAEWIDAHEEEFRLLREAATRPRMYLPSPTLLEDRFACFYDMILSDVLTCREAVWLLATRDMLMRPQDTNADAHHDIKAAMRISEMTPDYSLVGQVFVISCHDLLRRASLSYLTPESNGEMDARAIRRMYLEVESRNEMATTINEFERMSLITVILAFATNRADANGWLAGGNEEFVDWLRGLRVDWNVALGVISDWFDQGVKAAGYPQYTSRAAALASWDLAFENIDLSRWRVVSAMLSCSVRSHVAGDIFAMLSLPATGYAASLQDNHNGSLQLTQIAAALAVYRAEHGAYPADLSALVPGLLAELPVDSFLGKPLMYRRIGEGYLLVNVGPNGESDGGMNAKLGYYDGCDVTDLNQPSIRKLLGLPAADDDLRESIPAESDDLAIRMPLPRVDWQAIRVGEAGE